jgi:protein involved in polysaccharide export with SLBB domain
MSPTRRHLSLGLCLWALVGPGLMACVSTGASDKRILQYLNQEGFGKRFAGNPEEQNYVTIGDSIQYVDSYNLEVAGIETVEIDGTILIPEAGAVFVAGMTRPELESFLTQKLSPYFLDTDIKVKIRTGGSRAYYVWGEVTVPGRKAFLGDTTVFEAVLAAGPKEHTANLGRVKLIRADPRNPLVIPVNVADMWDSGDSTFNVSVQEYDIVYVPPTLLKQFADLVSAVLVPIITPFTTIIRAVLLVENDGNFNNRRNR